MKMKSLVPQNIKGSFKNQLCMGFGKRSVDIVYCKWNFKESGLYWGGCDSET